MSHTEPVPDQSDSVSFDPTDPQIWGAMVDRMAEKMADRMWGTRLWYLGVANDALTAAFLHLDPKDTQRVLRVYIEPPDDEPEGSGPFGF